MRHRLFSYLCLSSWLCQKIFKQGELQIFFKQNSQYKLDFSQILFFTCLFIISNFCCTFSFLFQNDRRVLTSQTFFSWLADISSAPSRCFKKNARTCMNELKVISSWISTNIVKGILHTFYECVKILSQQEAKMQFKIWSNLYSENQLKIGVTGFLMETCLTGTISWRLKWSRIYGESFMQFARHICLVFKRPPCRIHL